MKGSGGRIEQLLISDFLTDQVNGALSYLTAVRSTLRTLVISRENLSEVVQKGAMFSSPSHISRLELHVSGYQAFIPFLGTKEMAALSSSLEHLKFTGIVPRIPDISQSKLKHLELILTHQSSPSRFLHLLNNWDELKTLIISLPMALPLDSSTHAHQTDSLTPVSMPNLRELCLETKAVSPINGFWPPFISLA
jgi:hypothetical protein